MKNTISKKWAYKIKRLRKERGYSQAELARKLDVSRQSINEIERGKKRLTLERLYKILDALGYSADISLKERDVKVRSDWHSLAAEDPGIRRQIREARDLAEQLADFLYDKYSVRAVYVFGSLVENGGRGFTENSDIDLLVDGLEVSKLFEAKSTLEIEVLEKYKETKNKNISFDLILTNRFSEKPEKMRRNKRAVYIPKKND